MTEIKLLDCTLRDGGYINDWEFGNENIINIFERLVSSHIDIIEVGFLDQKRKFDENRTIQPNTEGYNKIFEGLQKKDSLIVGMIDYGTCNIENIQKCNECFLDGIRVIFKKNVMHEAIQFCSQIKKLGYKVFAQAVSITSYNDEELQELIGLVNNLQPYAFSLVDTYGLLHKNQLLHYYNFADKYLNEGIGLGYHSHNNFQLAYANCIELMENPPQNRMVLVDGTLYGMGKSAGNAPTELLADYMNSNLNKQYHTSQILEAIDVTILDIFHRIPWGYSFKFYIAASHDCHPSYVTYLMDKKKLSIKSIHEILNNIQYEKKLLYDENYIETLYLQYQAITCNDEIDRLTLQQQFTAKDILLIGPGENILKQKEQVEEYIQRNHPIVISVNYIPDVIGIDYLFVSNAKRYVRLSKCLSKTEKYKVIATSNVTKASGDFDFILQYGKLLDDEALMKDNPMIMLIHLLAEYQVNSIGLAGFDGYEKTKTSNYVNPNMEYSFSKDKAEQINKDVIESIRRIQNLPQINYVTASKYSKED